jgi:flagellar motor switch/type III secretory pathway protein FliN
MARAIVWPSISAETPPSALAGALDMSALAAAFGPELARLAGARITAHSGPAKSKAPILHLASVALAQPADLSAIALGAPADSAAHLLERLFGARPGKGAPSPAGVETLPPGSAAWATLCRILVQALIRSLPAANAAPSAPARLPDRPRALASEPAFQLDLDIEGVSATLSVALDPARPAPPPSARDIAGWRQRAGARVLDLDLPVALRLAERRIGLADLACLRAGDILPLDRPDEVDLLAGGRCIARLPAASLLPPEGSGS